MKRLFVFLGLCAALTLGAGPPRAETLVMGLVPAGTRTEDGVEGKGVGLGGWRNL